uniref:Bifunctional autolysin n=1 Tax=Ganoderma boninense TaxID=34458 RepID=A0A5K1K524_9APHY|nr:Bifunctional autolysin [Ganoderma boninense]
MSPQLISSYYRRDSHQTQAIAYQGEDAPRLLEQTGTVYTYHGQDISADVLNASDFGEREEDELLFATPEGSVEEDAPPSTQPRPPMWNEPGALRANDIALGTAFWFKISVAIDEPVLGDRLQPRVSVRLVDPPASRDPAAFQAGVVIEQRMQDGLRREIVEALELPSESPVFRSSSLY